MENESRWKNNFFVYIRSNVCSCTYVYKRIEDHLSRMYSTHRLCSQSSMVFQGWRIVSFWYDTTVIGLCSSRRWWFHSPAD